MKSPAMSITAAMGIFDAAIKKLCCAAYFNRPESTNSRSKKYLTVFAPPRLQCDRCTAGSAFSVGGKSRRFEQADLFSQSACSFFLGDGTMGKINSASDDRIQMASLNPAVPRGPRQQGAQGFQALHITHHGILSRAPMEALVHRGVNLRELRKIERLLRVELRSQGIFAEMIFDRAWASYLRCLVDCRC